MVLVVQKYGGSSVSGVDVMRRVAWRIVATREAGNTVIVVVSTIGDTTDGLFDQAAALTTDALTREMDILLSAGECVFAVLLAMAVSELGVPARVYTGARARVFTDSKYGKVSIVGVLPEHVARSIQTGSVAVVAGSQGISEVEDITTLGCGGPDTIAVVLATALNADVCEIYTDVDGLFTVNPRIIPTAKRIESLSNEETSELAAHGARIPHLRTVEYARRFGVPLHVRSSFSNKTGTWTYDGRREGTFAPLVVATQFDGVAAADTDSIPSAPSVASLAVPQSAGAAPASPPDPAGPSEGPSVSVVDTAYRNAIAARVQARPRSFAKKDHVEAPVTPGIAHDRNQDKITLVGVFGVPGTAVRTFAIVVGTGTNIDMIVQDVSAEGMGLTNISFTCLNDDSVTAHEALEAACEELGSRSLHFNPDIDILSLVGAGVRSNPGVSACLFGSLSEAGVNIHMISTSGIHISAVVDDAVLDEVMCAVCSAFGPDAQAVEVIVYGGAGR